MSNDEVEDESSSWKKDATMKINYGVFTDDNNK